MIRRPLHLTFAVVISTVAMVSAGPSPAPNASASPSPAKAAAAKPRGSGPSSPRELVDGLSSADLQSALELLKTNYVNPDALTGAELDRATLEGLLSRLSPGASLIAEATPDTANSTPFYSDIVLGHVGYLRLGDLSRANLDSMDASLQTFAAKKVDAVIVDLRASGSGNDFEIAAEFAKRFCPKGKPLFSLRKRAEGAAKTFTDDRDPAYTGLMIVLADEDTSGASEALGGVLRLYTKALVIGTATAGRAAESTDLKLASGKVLRVAVSEAVLPDGPKIFPNGLKPDLPVEMAATDKREVFVQSREKGIGPFVFEAERPHLNEAALLSGRNPELEAAEAAQRRGRAAEKSALRDPVLQRALDVVTSIGIYQHR